MNVAYHSSDKYAPILGTSIASLFENNKSMNHIDVYVIEENISLSNKEKLLQLAECYHRNIFFISMPDMNKEYGLGLKKVRADWIFNSYCRLFLDRLLPTHITKVLYLDSDILVTGDLSELWATDMTEYCAAGVKDCLNTNYYKVLGLDDCANYCNSGVILENLELWRTKNIGQQIRNYINQNGGYVFFMEQSVYNAVFQRQIKILPPEFNTYTLMQCLKYDELIRLRKPKDFYSRDEIEHALQNHKLVHLTSTFLITNRAWYQETNHPQKETFRYYKNLTPWKNELGFPDDRSTLRKAMHFFVALLPKGIMISITEYLYNTLRLRNIKRLQKKYKRKAKYI